MDAWETDPDWTWGELEAKARARIEARYSEGVADALAWVRDSFNLLDTEDVDALNDAIEKGVPS